MLRGHLHLRGAQSFGSCRRIRWIGTSPLAWSSEKGLPLTINARGDISTRVELRCEALEHDDVTRGHLHSRGAQSDVAPDVSTREGTSPLAWSSDLLSGSLAVGGGDISTRVELSTRCLLLRLCLWGHLHSRGAQATAQPSHQVTTGTSPLAWSSGNSKNRPLAASGDISTRVELRYQTSLQKRRRLGHLHSRGAQDCDN